MMSARRRLKSRRGKYVTEGQSSWSGFSGWAFEKEGYAGLGILGNNSVSGYPSTTGISAHKKGSIEQSRSSIHLGNILKLRYISQATGLYC